MEKHHGYERKNDLGYALVLGAVFVLSVLGAVLEFAESESAALAKRAAAVESAVKLRA